MAAAKPVLEMRFTQLKVFSGNANLVLAGKICAALGCTPGSVSVKTFSDGEIHLQVQENVRGADCFVVQPTCTPVDHNPIMGTPDRTGKTGRACRFRPGWWPT